jgi:uncharacterized membrane protein
MNALTIVFRLLHIVTGVLWVGGLAILAWFIIPAVFMSGATGGAFMQTVTQRTKMLKYLPSIGGLAVLSGFVLFWRDMTMGGASFANSRMGMTLSLGGLAALAALIIGAIMSARSAKEIGRIGAAIASAGAPPSAEQAQRMDLLRGRMKKGSTISVWLALIATMAMAVARYV